MKLVVLTALALFCVIGCGSSESAMTDAEKNAITVKSPDVTAEEASKRLANSDLPPEVKKVIGGGQGNN
jgi:hypothetical protein